MTRRLGAAIPFGGVPGTGGGGGGGTTDFTQATLQTDESFACAFDAAGDLVGWVLRTIEDNLGEAGLTVTASGLVLIDVNGVTTSPYDPAAAGHTLGTCAAVADSAPSELQICTKCDDVNGDGSLYGTYTEVAVVTLDDLGVPTRTVSGTFATLGANGAPVADNSLTTAYTPANPVDCDSIGGEVVGLKQHRVVLDAAGTWTRPALTTAVTVITRAIGDPANPPTVTDADGTPTNLQLGSEDWGAEWASNSNVLAGSFSVSTNADDLVTIIYTTLETN